jgi:hypothetical protein
LKFRQNKEDEGLLGVVPEWIEKITLENRKEIYKIPILYNNDYMMFFYLPKEIVVKDKELKKWIDKNI